MTGCRRFEDLPKTAQTYVRRLEDLIGTRISGIGVGPDREQQIPLHDLL
ncbi:MAG TPA: adenylosuccinate synthetase [Propionibacteriaceae bacterium]